MTSAELVNLIIEKLRRVKFVAIAKTRVAVSVQFVWGNNYYTAVTGQDKYVHIYTGTQQMEAYTDRLEGMLNGLVRNDAGELVQCSN